MVCKVPLMQQRFLNLLKTVPRADGHVWLMISVHTDKYAIEHVRPVVGGNKSDKRTPI